MKWLVSLILLMIAAQVGDGCPGFGGTKYFLVSVPGVEDSDSYILPLSDPADIAHARALIRNPEDSGGRIVLATIEHGGRSGQYVNRDLLNENREWSWHVSEFQGFVDVTIEIYDGSPTLVEEDLHGWFNNTGGVIGFWSYTVTREVSRLEVIGFPFCSSIL